ncbi:unannotated protein [freshwater metagenome]|uniref:Unannotated protein n=1 Tax=freshwater metagenome TaxID=449393 RepID=A0A6J6XGG5_9ZZZZ
MGFGLSRRTIGGIAVIHRDNALIRNDVPGNTATDAHGTKSFAITQTINVHRAWLVIDQRLQNLGTVMNSVLAHP